MVNEDALYGNAGLAGIPKSTGSATLGGELDISIRFDHDTRIATELKRDFFFPHLAFNIHPTATLPVKLSNLNRGSTTIRSATRLSHGTTFSPPGGTPASTATSPSKRAVSGV